MMHVALSIVTGAFALFAACAWAADLRFSGIGEVALKAGAAARSRHFYTEVLGFDAVPGGPASGRAWYKVNDDQFLLIVPDRRDGTDHHLAHFSLTTSDVRLARETLRQRGVETTAVSRGDDGSLQCILRDPDGNPIVMAQAVAGSLAVRTRGRLLGDRRVSARLRHVGIQVADLDRAVSFYQDKLGLVSERLQHGKTQWANMQLPGGDYIQMRITPGKSSPDGRWGLEHIGFDVADAHATYQALVRRGIPPRPAFEPVVGYAGHLKINFIDPDDMVVELMELRAAKANERREP